MTDRHHQLDCTDRTACSQMPQIGRRKLLSASMLALFCGTLVLSGCGKDEKTTSQPKDDAGAAPKTAGAAAAAAGAVKKIGIVQLVTHEALDDAVKGFQDRLVELGYGIDGADGKRGSLSIDLQNAHGDSATLQAIASRFVSAGCDLIYAVSTPALQAAARATRTIPIVATAVTSFERAKVVSSDE